jgi:hypothetical protein
VLEYFRHVLLLASEQDRYVPHHSARIEICAEALRDAKRGAARLGRARVADEWRAAGAFHVEMVNALLRPLRPEMLLLRVDVAFAIKGRILDSAIGRAAHIQFLDSPSFVRLFVNVYREILTA